MKIMVINLDRAPERLERIRTIFDAAGVPFERMRAVDGRQLSEAEIDRWRQGEPRFYLLGPGETACFLSHRQCWEIAARTGEPVVVFEDDIHLGRDAAELLGDPSWIPADADIVKLDTTMRPAMVDRKSEWLPTRRRISRVRSLHGAAAGYLVTSNGAKTLLRSSETFSDPVDQFLFNPVSEFFNTISVYQIYPALAVHSGISPDAPTSNLGSYLYQERRQNRRRGFAKVKRAFTRPAEKLIQGIVRFYRSIFCGERIIRVKFE
jgi:glycosyl transferase, family 25